MLFLARVATRSVHNHTLPKRRATSCISALRKTSHHPDAEHLLRQIPQRQNPSPSSNRSISSISSRVLPMAHNEPLAPGATIQGYSGRTYTIEEIIAERRNPLLCVYRARYDPGYCFSKLICCAYTDENLAPRARSSSSRT